MKQPMLIFFIFILLATTTSALTTVALDHYAGTQLRKLNNGNLMYLEDNHTLVIRGENYEVARYDELTRSMSDLINYGVTDKNTNKLYYYDNDEEELVIIDAELGTQTTHDLSSNGMRNATLAAVLENTYVFGLKAVNVNKINTYMRITKDTHLNASNVTLMNTTLLIAGYDEGLYDDCAGAVIDPTNGNGFARSYCLQPQYVDGYDTRVILPIHSREAPTKSAATYRRHLYYVIDEDESNDAYFVKGDIYNGQISYGRAQLYNDQCTGATLTTDEDYYVVCAAGDYISSYNHDTEVIGAYDYTVQGYAQGAELYDDNEYALVTSCGATYCYSIHLYQQGSGAINPITGPTSSPAPTPIYTGYDMHNMSADGSYQYVRVGDTMYYINDDDDMESADLTDAYDITALVYAKTRRNSVAYDDSLPNTTYVYYQDGTLEWPYEVDPEININFDQAGTDGVYQRQPAATTTGSEQTLQLLIQLESNTNITPYISVDCTTGEKDLNELELWTDDATTLQAEYEINTSWLRLAYPVYPISEYTEEVTETDAAKGVVFNNNHSEMTKTLSTISNNPSMVESALIASEGTATLTLYDRYDNEQVVIEHELTASEYTVTINDETVMTRSATLYQGADVYVVITVTSTEIRYDINGEEQGTIAETSNVPIRTLEWEVDSTSSPVVIGPYAFFDEAIINDLTTGTYEATDDYNLTYWSESCTYTDAEPHEITVRTSVTETSEPYVVTFTYEYDAQLDLYVDTLIDEGVDITTSEEDINALHAEICSWGNVCNENTRLLLAVIIMVATVLSAMSAMSEKYHQTAATAAVPFMLLAVEFIFFAAYDFFPTWFTILGAVSVAAVIASKFNFFVSLDRGG